MTIAAVTAPKAPVAQAAFAYGQARAVAAAVAAAPVARTEPAQRIEIRHEIVRPGMEAVFAARSAESARFDCRVTGATETVRNFDRLAMVIEGFEHLREIFEGVRAQVREDFGLAGAEATAETPATGLDARL